jgi:hypothetical protein
MIDPIEPSSELSVFAPAPSPTMAPFEASYLPPI